MQKYDHCELCGNYTILADYGFNREFICVDCSLKDPVLTDHVTKEMEKRHGKEKLSEWTKEASPGTRH